MAIFRHRGQRRDGKFDELFRSSYPSLYRHAYALLHDEEDSRDIVSEVFASIIREGTEGGLPGIGYLMAMVHNRSIDLLRRRKTEDEARAELLLNYQTYIAPDRNKEERLDEILGFIDRELTPQTRRILQMCYDEKMTYREVAEKLDISTHAVNKHISQALRKLRERFNPQGNNTKP